MKLQARIAILGTALAVACGAAMAPARAAEYTLKWAVVTRGDMQENLGHKLAEILPKATQRPC